MRGRRSGRSRVTLALAMLALGAPAVGLKKEKAEPLPENLSEPHRLWLDEVRLLTQDAPIQSPTPCSV